MLKKLIKALTPKPMTVTLVDCPKHGQHRYKITSGVEGVEGVWCMLCWLESLGEPLPTIEREAE